ncbi:MAG: hypothetical protein JO350_06625, partial [Candidatus Eremiobacteraeota bacterium]|nr:hypothetical protein [Candidatus Eremiobacteraeota bacterium]
AVIEAKVRKAEIERHAAPAFLRQSIRIRSRERRDERRLSVIDVPRRSNDVHEYRGG